MTFDCVLQFMLVIIGFNTVTTSWNKQLSARKKALSDRWVNDEDFTVKIQDRDLRKDPQARELISQIQVLCSAFPDRYTRLVEVGSGDGKMLDLLSRKVSLELIGSDLPGHRLEQAVEDYPHLGLQAADLVTMAKEYARPNTVFFAMNVLGNITERELVTFFRILQKRGSALIFSARDLALDTEMLYLDKGMAFSYNYKELVRRTNMTFFASLHRYQESGCQQGGLVATVVRRKQLKGSRVAQFHGKKIIKPSGLRVIVYRLLRMFSLRP